MVLARYLICGLVVDNSLVALAQSGGPYDLSWHNIGPGGSANGGSYSPDASIVWQRLLSTG